MPCLLHQPRHARAQVGRAFTHQIAENMGFAGGNFGEIFMAWPMAVAAAPRGHRKKPKLGQREFNRHKLAVDFAIPVPAKAVLLERAVETRTVEVGGLCHRAIHVKYDCLYAHLWCLR